MMVLMATKKPQRRAASSDSATSAKLFGIALFASIIGVLLSAPMYLYAALSLWADQCSYGVSPPCSSGTQFSLLLWMIIWVGSTVYIGYGFLRKFGHYNKPKPALELLVMAGLALLITLPIFLRNTIFAESVSLPDMSLPTVLAVLILAYPIYVVAERHIKHL